MATRPTKLPRWADVSGTLTEPSEAKKDAGFIAERPTFGVMNWLLNLMHEWIQWFSKGYSEQARIGLESSIESALNMGLTFVNRRTPTHSIGVAVEYAMCAFGYIYASTTSNTVLKINPVTKTVVATFTGFTSPHKIVSDGTRLWVTNRTNSHISVINPVDGTLIQDINTGATAGGIQGICYDNVDSMWTGSDAQTGHIKKINTTTYAVTDIAHASFDTPHDFCCDGTHVWVTNYNGGSLSKVNISTNAVDATLSLGTNPDRCIFDGFTQHVFVTDRGSDSVYDVNPDTVAVAATIALTGGDDPIYLVSDGLKIWVSKQGADAVAVINPVGGAVITTYTFPGTSPSPSGICTDGREIFCFGNTTNMFVITPGR